MRLGSSAATTLIREGSYAIPKPTFSSRLKDIAVLFKMRLTVTVVISAVLGYLLAATGGSFSYFELVVLMAGGILVSGASNGFNQVIERKLDAKMDRTSARPLARGEMSPIEGILISSVAGIIGIVLLWVFLNPLSGILGAMALFFYVALYTPMKRISPLAVFVGAIPGAIPPMLGWVACTGTFGLEPGILFVVQFMWQFPHFWAIAWVVDDDYKKAGFRLLPSKDGRDGSSAFQILLYSVFLIPVAMLPWVFDMSGLVSMVIAVLCGMGMSWFAKDLYNKRGIPQAKKLMFASFIYLPIVLLVFVLDKI